MKKLLMVGVLLSACHKPPEARVVNELPVESGIMHRFDVDTLRGKKDGAPGAQRFAEFVRSHLLPVGVPQPGPEIPGATVQRVKLPSPGYLVRVRIKPRADDFCNVTIDLVSEQGDAPLERAPFAAIQAFEAVHVGVATFLPPRLGALDNVRYARLAAQAAKLGAEGKDPPLTMVEFKRVPRPVQQVPQDEYWVPPSTDSTLRKNPAL